MDSIEIWRSFLWELMPNVHHCLEGSDTFFKKGADKDGALKFSATNKDLKNIKYFNINIKSI